MRVKLNSYSNFLPWGLRVCKDNEYSLFYLSSGNFIYDFEIKEDGIFGPYQKKDFFNYWYYSRNIKEISLDYD